MSDYCSRSDIKKYLEKLLDQATPNLNDKRHRQYIDYFNGFLGYFGDERVYLVGSTAEETKLRSSKDNGDADFLMVSGRLTIPASQLEPKKDTPSFVWVRGDQLDAASRLGIEMTESSDGKKYLAADILHDLDPRLFTILRGIYRIVTSTSDGVPGRSTRVTTLGESSSVGLARTELRGLEIKDKGKIPQLRKYFPKRLQPREPRCRRQRSETDQELNQILELITLCTPPHSHTEDEGQFSHFAAVVKLLLVRQREENLQQRGEEPIVRFEDDMDIDSDDFERFENDLDLPTDVKVTYKEKTMKDFVPALKIVGRLGCMKTWDKEHGRWLPAAVKGEIVNSEIYVVAKTDPLSPDKRDFCLAFNHAEVKLAKALTQTQRKCLLVLKAIYKGIFENIILKPFDKVHRLKSFHLKTALYWVLEETVGSEIWEEENLTGAVRRVLFFLRKALQQKSLCHYFVQSNLFSGFDTDMCKALINGIDQIAGDPLMALVHFFDLDRQTEVEIVLTDEQIQHLIYMARDGGVEKEADTLEDAMEDFKRGFSDTRKEKGHVPLKEALNHVMEIYLRFEGERKAKEELKKLNIPAPENLSSVISGLIGGLRGSSSQQGSSTSETPCRNSGDLLNLAGNLLHGNQPQTSQQHQPSTARSQAQALESTRRTLEEGSQIMDVFNAFLSGSARGEQRRSLEGQAKQLGLSHFLGKPE